MRCLPARIRGLAAATLVAVSCALANAGTQSSEVEKSKSSRLPDRNTTT
jgi:hypothetical protein